jgi:anti-sigma B factor antagonist
MEIIIEQQNDGVPVTIFRIEGAITAASYRVLQQQAEDAYAAGARDLLLDLSAVPFMDSAGLRALHQIYMLLRSSRTEEGDHSVRKGIAAGTYSSSHLKLLNPNRDVLQVLSLAGFDMFLEVYSNSKKALASFQATDVVDSNL